jgi:hypothetical protein
LPCWASAFFTSYRRTREGIKQEKSAELLLSLKEAVQFVEEIILFSSMDGLARSEHAEPVTNFIAGSSLLNDSGSR